jgi:hypothetical protein
MDDPDWPDFIDVYTGVLTYFGDNKEPGIDLHETSRRGNKLLQSCFTSLHNAPDQRGKIPPSSCLPRASRGGTLSFGAWPYPAWRPILPTTWSHLAQQERGALPELPC